MRFELVENAQRDLLDIRQQNPKVFAAVYALIKQIEADPKLADRLLEAACTENGVNFSRWVAQFRRGRDIYRIKAVRGQGLACEDYRIVYAYMPPGRGSRNGEYFILGVLHRSVFDYEDENDYTKRMLRDYFNL